MTCKDCSYEKICGMNIEACERMKDKALYGDLSINTRNPKYNIGDNVWIADFFYDMYSPRKHESKVVEIIASTTANWSHIDYLLEYENRPGLIIREKRPENACFSSYEECAQWCDVQNNK